MIEYCTHSFQLAIDAYLSLSRVMSFCYHPCIPLYNEQKTHKTQDKYLNKWYCDFCALSLLFGV